VALARPWPYDGVLLHPTCLNVSRTRVKICGITRVEDLDAALAVGADALGFVFYPRSPRYLEVSLAAELANRVPPFVTRVGLFVNAEPDFVRSVLSAVPLDLLQFHGEEEAGYCAQFGRSYIKAARVRPGLDLLEFARAYRTAQAILLDAYVEGYGGAGRVFDWSLIPRSLPLPIILSGGLTPENVGAAVGDVSPWAVDVSSGVEAAKGIKDAAKIAAFMAAVKNADAGR
jgi:phosphoribosylanthranilate isomerase